jgi:hypothetical protein
MYGFKSKRIAKLSKKYTNFAENYFVKVNQTACSDNEIELPVEVGKLPDLREVYEKALSNNIPDLPFYFNANHGSVLNCQNWLFP